MHQNRNWMEWPQAFRQYGNSKVAMLSIIKSKYSTTVLFFFIHFSKVYQHNYRHGFWTGFRQGFSTTFDRANPVKHLCEGREIRFPGYWLNEWRHGSILPFIDWGLMGLWMEAIGIPHGPLWSSQNLLRRCVSSVIDDNGIFHLTTNHWNLWCVRSSEISHYLVSAIHSHCEVKIDVRLALVAKMESHVK